MSLLCSSSCRNNSRNSCSGQCGSVAGAACGCRNAAGNGNGNGCGCGCAGSDDESTQVAGAATPEPTTIRALLQTVKDSCCTTEDVCREITVSAPEIFDPETLEIGSVLSVELDGDITYKEVQRDQDDCACVSTVRFNIPVRIYGTDNSCCSQYITRNITVIRSVKLCCTGDSELTANNSRVIALSAVVTEIDEPEITFTICLLFRSCLQQVVLREYTWEATPVCVSPNCAEARTLLTDNCDLTCGCVAGASCPSC